MEELLAQIRACTVCAPHLPHLPRPVLRASPASRILIVGQAPGRKVHETGVPWNDASGRLLREWLKVSDQSFYDTRLFAIIPMGFCYPGKGAGGDLPPRLECAPLWHAQLLAKLPNLRLTLLIGQYAQHHYLGTRRSTRLRDTVRNFSQHLPKYLPMPHPSPRNRRWLTQNPWFATELLPVLRDKVAEILADPLT